MANGIDLAKGVEFEYTAGSDVSLQNVGSSIIYISESTFDNSSNPRNKWTQIPFQKSIVIANGKTVYFYCSADASMAEMSM